MRPFAAVLALLLVAGCAGKLFYLPAPGKQEGGWSQFGGSPEGCAFAPGAPEAPLRLQWQQSLGAAPVGSPLVEGQLVLQLSAGPSLLAFDRYSGQRLGRRGLNAPVSAAGVLLGTRLVVGEAGPKPALRSYERQGNQVAWTYKGLACAPLAGRGDTLVAALNSGEVLALGSAAGQRLWRVQLGGPLWAAPALGTDAVFVGDGGKGLVALELAGGRQRWQRDLGAGLRSVATGGGLVYAVTATGTVLACSADSGQVRWRVELKVLPAAGMALAGGVLALGAADHLIYGLDAQTGQVRWQFETRGVVCGAPAAGKGTIYAGSSEGYLYAVERDSGRLAWKYQLDGPALQPVALGEGLVVVATEEGTLYVFGK
ncbi:MAG: PQQ-binding-like beta-propeller repeat protein [Candidatus Latescibacteria bacterium]|nr:PQQ-binding-like beta-propeller repeat protein [Candidatus Latescibacterota bacterium]